MKTITMRWLAMGALGAGLAAVGAPVRAQDVTPLLPAVQFGMMGAIRGEVVRLSISNFGVPDPNLPPGPCHATIALVDAQGDTLRRADGSLVTRTVNLLPGRSASLQIHPGAFLGPDDVRLNFRPVVLVEVPPDPYTPPDPCVPSLEIIDNATGQTRLVSSGIARAYAGNHNETLIQDR